MLCFWPRPDPAEPAALFFVAAMLMMAAIFTSFADAKTRLAETSPRPKPCRLNG